MVDFYVYYKVRSIDAARLAPLVHAMARRLEQDAGVRVALKRRPEDKDGLQTWMEVYPGVTEGFEAVLAQVVDDAGISPYLAGPRRLEIFTDLPCA
ncbi:MULTISPECIES: DUF4936 family protein [Massilia]|jgi:hypothetical protein|uniref:DUF4936 domain-containing protein n=1 Tax=Massilia timonae CCUG 45783 TaxID=883126 RepID=K9DLT8_9BURK|nr:MULTISPECIES: DUF4936 family protein [Massilia]EKU79767.1 hypothetical protein HMPREF9710_04963 [Massilia timonae CCUG 45783]QYG02632.1 DUF4936 family protein [Massilia sp. NP310]HAK92232.1 DUF4936 domain-containing protein [Massilia timonae]